MTDRHTVLVVDDEPDVREMLALLLELTKKAIRSPYDLERSLRLRPVATVPFIYTYEAANAAFF